ncbi:MAG: hypothetical protein Q4D81_09525 [Eubacteriales bacterium]|nr:hypothetical protein [Eubacteriales bacterium]
MKERGMNCPVARKTLPEPDPLPAKGLTGNELPRCAEDAAGTGSLPGEGFDGE